MALQDSSAGILHTEDPSSRPDSDVKETTLESCSLTSTTHHGMWAPTHTHTYKIMKEALETEGKDRSGYEPSPVL